MEKKEIKRKVLGGTDYYFEAQTIFYHYKKVGMDKVCSMDEYMDKFRTARAIVKFIYKNELKLNAGYNVIELITKDDIRVAMPIYLHSKSGAISIPIYNNIIAGKERYIGLTNIIYARPLDVNRQKTYFKKFKDIKVVTDEEVKSTVYRSFAGGETIDGVKYRGDGKYTLIKFTKDDVFGTSKAKSKKKVSRQANIEYKPEYKKPYEKKEYNKASYSKEYTQRNFVKKEYNKPFKKDSDNDKKKVKKQVQRYDNDASARINEILKDTRELKKK